jgi:hypothetical protein
MNAPNPVSAWLRALPGLSRREVEPVGRLDLIGLDMAPTHSAPRTQTIVPAIAAVVIAALLLVGLRVEVLRLRYASAEAVTREQRLRDEKRTTTVSLLRLREPKLLSRRAAKLGFAKPDRVVDLPAPAKFEAPQVGPGPRP